MVTSTLAALCKSKWPSRGLNGIQASQNISRLSTSFQPPLHTLTWHCRKESSRTCFCQAHRNTSPGKSALKRLCSGQNQRKGSPKTGRQETKRWLRWRGERDATRAGPVDNMDHPGASGETTFKGWCGKTIRSLLVKAMWATCCPFKARGPIATNYSVRGCST